MDIAPSAVQLIRHFSFAHFVELMRIADIGSHVKPAVIMLPTRMGMTRILPATNIDKLGQFQKKYVKLTLSNNIFYARKDGCMAFDVP